MFESFCYRVFKKAAWLWALKWMCSLQENLAKMETDFNAPICMHFCWCFLLDFLHWLFSEFFGWFLFPFDPNCFCLDAVSLKINFETRLERRDSLRCYCLPTPKFLSPPRWRLSFCRWAVIHCWLGRKKGIIIPRLVAANGAPKIWVTSLANAVKLEGWCLRGNAFYGMAFSESNTANR